MASLADTLKQRRQKGLTRGPGGVLTEESPEEIQSLAGQAGLAAPPTTAIGAGMIGANQDQQKMMGTPAQKQAALDIASQVPEQQTLATTLRRDQPRAEATAVESQAIEKSEDMKNLGSLGDRVTDIINTQRQLLQEQGQSGQGVEVQTAPEFQGKDVSSIKDLLGEFRKDPGNQQLLLQINQSLGYDVNRQLSPAEVDQLYESAVDSIARGGAGVVDDDLNVEDLINLPNFGYDMDTLSELLGIPREEVSKYTVGQLREAVDKTASDEFSKVQGLEQQTQSGQLGTAERGLARQAAREASRVGTRSSEADVANLESQIANADQVTFAGREYKVDDLLRDDTISGIISEYMNSAPGSEIRQAIEKQEPGLLDFIKKNEALLQDASTQMQAGAQTFQDTQSYNRSLRSTPFGGVDLDESVARAIIPGYGQLQAARVNIDDVPVLKYVTSRGADAGRQFASEVNTEVSKDPSFAEQLAGIPDAGVLDNLRIEENGPKWQGYKQASDMRRAIEKIDTNSIHSVLGTMLQGYNPEQVGQVFNSLNASTAGVLDPQLAKILDANGDGQFDGENEIKSRLLSFQPKPTLVAASQDRMQKYTPPQSPKISPEQKSAGDKLIQSMRGSGKISPSADTIANMSIGELEAVKKSQQTAPGLWDPISKAVSTPDYHIAQKKAEAERGPAGPAQPPPQGARDPGKGISGTEWTRFTDAAKDTTNEITNLDPIKRTIMGTGAGKQAKRKVEDVSFSTGNKIKRMV